VIFFFILSVLSVYIFLYLFYPGQLSSSDRSGAASAALPRPQGLSPGLFNVIFNVGRISDNTLRFPFFFSFFLLLSLFFFFAYSLLALSFCFSALAC